MKVIAFYLPQFHEIPENNEWWGEGFTEWVNVKKAVPQFEGHSQPRLPLNENYYNLLDNEVKRWQIDIAKSSGVYGFCYYHYWFDGKLLLQRPMEQMLQDKSLDMPFCICWANEAWTRSWVGENEVLIPQKYGKKADWKKHFDYLLPFLLDDRYIKIDGCPLVVIYRPEVISCIRDMQKYWLDLAKDSGLPGLKFAYQQVTPDLTPGFDAGSFDYDIEFQPIYGMYFGQENIPAYKKTRLWSLARKSKRILFNSFERVSGIDLDRQRRKDASHVDIISYDKVWEGILSMEPVSKASVPGAYVGWDDTPRKGINGHVHVGATPEKFYRYMKRLIEKAVNEYHSDFIFMTAWNEWAEGSILEPDEKNGFGYLDALHRALLETNELPEN